MVAETPAPAEAGAIVAVGQVQKASGSVVNQADIEQVKKLLTQTKAIGVILPPPDIRAIVDKTAQFVAKNGAEFEARILASEANNVKFNFLQPTDPYHAYYRMRVKHFQEPEDQQGGEAAPAKEGTTAAAAATAAASAAAAAAAAAPAAVTTRPLEKPEDEKYTVHVPEGLTGLDLDVIKLTAQFVARNGASFLTGLTTREANNPQFYFLKPTHSLFGFFTALADAYSAVLMPDKDLKKRLGEDAADRAMILERCLKRLEWDRARAREAQALEDELERERVAMQQIDWHDFTIVETIDFYDDEDEELPPPMSLKELVAFNKQQAAGGGAVAEQEAAAAGAADAAMGEANGAPPPMDDAERALLAEAAEAQQPAAAAGGVAFNAAPEAPDEDMEDDMEVSGGEEDEGPIRVVKNYVRQTQRMAMTAGGQQYDPTRFAVSPITGELIAHADMAEHMRISLLDPKWKEQKEAMLSKIKDTTKADDDEITRNLIGLAKTRPDIFGSTEEELAEVVTAAVKEKQTSGQGRAVAWDGQTMGGSALRTQVAAIQDNRREFNQHGAVPSSSNMPQAGPSMGQQQQQRMPQQPPPHMQQQQAPAPLLPPPPRPAPGGPPNQQQQQQQPPVPPPVLPPPPQQQQQQRLPAPGPPGGISSMPRFPGPPMGGGMPGFGMPPPPGGMPPPPMGMGGGMPPPPGMPPHMQAGGTRPGGPLADEAAAKRARLDTFVLQPEEEFLQEFSGASKVCVQCPEVEGSDKLVGQMLEVEVASLQDTVGHLKSRLEGVTGLAVNKQKLHRDGVGFLRDELSLAHYNVSPEVVLVLGTKTRGGKK